MGGGLLFRSGGRAVYASANGWTNCSNLTPSSGALPFHTGVIVNMKRINISRRYVKHTHTQSHGCMCVCVNTAGEDATCSGVVEHYVAIVNLASHSRCSSALGGWVRWVRWVGGIRCCWPLSQPLTQTHARTQVKAQKDGLQLFGRVIIKTF